MSLSVQVVGKDLKGYAVEVKKKRLYVQSVKIRTINAYFQFLDLMPLVAQKVLHALHVLNQVVLHVDDMYYYSMIGKTNRVI